MFMILEWAMLAQKKGLEGVVETLFLYVIPACCYSTGSVPVCMYVHVYAHVHVFACVCVCVSVWVWMFSLVPSQVNASSPSSKCFGLRHTAELSPFLGIEEIGGQLFGTRLDFKWHPREKFWQLILATQDLHWIKSFLYFHNFYIYMSFSILYSWVIQEKQTGRAIHNINNSTFYQSRNTYLWLEWAHLVKWWFLVDWNEMLSGIIKKMTAAWSNDRTLPWFSLIPDHKMPVENPLGALL